MSSIVYQGATSAEFLQIAHNLEKTRDQRYPSEIGVTVAPKSIKKTATYGASVLLAYGSSNLSERSHLIVKNLGRVQARIGENSTASIYEEGIPLEPGEVVTFNVDSTIELWARSTGYATELEITEV